MQIKIEYFEYSLKGNDARRYLSYYISGGLTIEEHRYDVTMSYYDGSTILMYAGPKPEGHKDLEPEIMKLVDHEICELIRESNTNR